MGIDLFQRGLPECGGGHADHPLLLEAQTSAHHLGFGAHRLALDLEVSQAIEGCGIQLVSGGELAFIEGR